MTEDKVIGHTPGPWTKEWERWPTRVRRVGSLELSEPVADVLLASSKERQEANAALIAAAPELLEALKEIHSLAQSGALVPRDGLLPERLDAIHQAGMKATDAIAKATGS